jgi:hypothetical protein
MSAIERVTADVTMLACRGEAGGTGTNHNPLVGSREPCITILESRMTVNFVLANVTSQS